MREGRWGEAVFNRMETAVFPDFPELAEIKGRLMEAGCPAAAMSGSGPTILGVCASREQGERAASQFPQHRISLVAAVARCVAGWD